jgi:hypothetical protein
MSAATWKRIRLDPATAIAWRSDGSLVIGFNDLPTSLPLHITSHSQHIATWLSLFDGSRSGHELLRSSMAMGVSISLASEVLNALAHGGHIFNVTSTAPTSIADTSLREIRALARLEGISVDEFATTSTSQRVLVHGPGALAAAIFADLRLTLGNVGWDPASTSRIRPEDAVGALDTQAIGKSWLELAVAIEHPTIVIVISDVLDLAELSNRFAGCAVLPIVAHQHRFAIGPLLGTEESMCGRCMHQLRKSRDAEWSFAVTQLTHHKRALPVHMLRQLHNVASTATLNIDALVRHQKIYGLLAESLELIAPNPAWIRRTWDRPTDCQCLTSHCESQSVQ